MNKVALNSFKCALSETRRFALLLFFKHLELNQNSMKHVSLIFFLVSIGFSASSQTFVSTSPSNRNAVLEEFTGVNCQYCPDGHKIANQLAASNPGRVLPINVHVGGYATPSAGQLDLRTSFGTPLDNQADVAGYPAGTVNRHLFSGLSQDAGTAMSRGDWGNAANQMLSQSSPVNVAGRASINMATRTLSVIVEAYYTSTSSASTNKLTVALLQNNIEGTQVGADLNPAAILPNGNYNHQHALRHFLTGQWGATISSTSTGSFYTDTFTYQLPADIRNIPLALGDLEVVVFVAEGNQEIITGAKSELSYVSPNAYDALPFAIAVPASVCGEEVEAAVTIQNFGSEPLTSLEIRYSVNDGAVVTYAWTGNLSTAQTTVVNLPSTTFSPESDNTFYVATASPNGNADQVVSNDNQTVDFQLAKNSGSDVTITLVTDNYGTETTWELKGPNGNVVASGGPYTNASVTYTENLTLADGCHEFILSDTYGDGICCEYGNGVYTIASGGVTVYQGVSFTTEEIRLFNVGGTASIDDVERVSDMSIYPNPFATDATLRFQLKKNANVALTVMNVLGESVINRQLGAMPAGMHSYKLSSDGLSSGMYLVSLLVDGQQLTSRISITK